MGEKVIWLILHECAAVFHELQVSENTAQDFTLNIDLYQVYD